MESKIWNFPNKKQISRNKEQGLVLVRIKLNELIEQQGISKNRLAHRAEMQRTQLNQYCNGEVTRLDIAVLARLCCALDCKVEDLLEYVPPEQE